MIPNLQPELHPELPWKTLEVDLEIIPSQYGNIPEDLHKQFLSRKGHLSAGIVGDAPLPRV